jgi:hypothetical protein
MADGEGVTHCFERMVGEEFRQRDDMAYIASEGLTMKAPR